jgi:hypothetical protein
MDDTSVVWPDGMDRLQDFFDHINSLWSSIQFTMDIDSTIPFLDVLISRKGPAMTTKV